MRRVFLESPYAGDVPTNLAYARACAADCLRRGEAPLASHLLYTQEGILRDDLPEERARGIEAGQAFLAVCEASVVYADRGISAGMWLGIEAARRLGIPVETRTLGDGWGDILWHLMARERTEAQEAEASAADRERRGDG